MFFKVKMPLFTEALFIKQLFPESKAIAERFTLPIFYQELIRIVMNKKKSMSFPENGSRSSAKALARRSKRLGT